jgi:hypothetical protein
MNKTVPTDRARQGRWGSHVLIILVVALMLAAGAWAIAEFYGASIEPSQPTQSTTG